MNRHGSQRKGAIRRPMIPQIYIAVCLNDGKKVSCVERRVWRWNQISTPYSALYRVGVTLTRKLSVRQSNCNSNEFCRCIKCRYKEGYLYLTTMFEPIMVFQYKLAPCDRCAHFSLFQTGKYPSFEHGSTFQIVQVDLSVRWACNIFIIECYAAVSCFWLYRCANK